MSTYRRRVSEKCLRQYLNAFPVVGITGPRQSGKSTLLQHTLKDYQYVTFDDPRNIAYFEEDPHGFMQQYTDRVIFDEVQYVPKIFSHIKLAVDNDRRNYGKFVITGSNQFSYLKSITESLAGRIGLLTLLPFQFTEMPKKLLKESIYKGAYPELVDRDYRDSDLWYSAYFDTYVNRDVRLISNIGNMRDFKRLISLMAANAAKILDMSHYASDLGLSVPTIKRWLSILEASYIVFLLPPFYTNYGKRIVKRPKLYFYDTGLISYLTGIKTEEQYDKGPMAGPIFENYIVSEIFKKEIHQKTDTELFYFRTSDKREIDLIVDRKQYKDFIEIKKTSTFKPSMLNIMRQFMKEEDKGYLLYNGEKFPYHGGMHVINYADYLG